MSRLVSRRAPLFAVHFVRTGGNATIAARQAGYRASCAASVGSYLLKNPIVLDLIAIQIRERAPGHEAALQRLMQESRPPGLRARMNALVTYENPTQPLSLETPAIPPADADLKLADRKNGDKEC